MQDWSVRKRRKIAGSGTFVHNMTRASFWYSMTILVRHENGWMNYLRVFLRKRWKRVPLFMLLEVIQ